MHNPTYWIETLHKKELELNKNNLEIKEMKGKLEAYEQIVEKK